MTCAPTLVQALAGVWPIHDARQSSDFRRVNASPPLQTPFLVCCLFGVAVKRLRVQEHKQLSLSYSSEGTESPSLFLTHKPRFLSPSPQLTRRRSRVQVALEMLKELENDGSLPRRNLLRATTLATACGERCVTSASSPHLTPMPDPHTDGPPSFTHTWGGHIG